MPPRVPVTYQFSRSCPSHEEGLDLLRRAADRAGVALELRVVEIEDDAQAEALGFAGSPTYVVGGRDVADPDPLMPHRADTCRAYVRGDGSIGPLPDAATLIQALRAGRRDDEEDS